MPRVKKSHLKKYSKSKSISLLKLLLLITLVSQLLLAKDISPTFKLRSMGIVSDFVVVNDSIYISNDKGSIDIFDLKTQKLKEQIFLNLVESDMDELLPAKILSIDYLNGKLLIVSIGKKAYRNVWIYENHQLHQIIDESKKLPIKKAKFANDEKIIIGTFASEIILHDFSESYTLYNRHVSQSTLGDIVLSEDKTQVLMADESGEVQLIDVKSSKTLYTYKSQNVDNIYHLAFANGVIITAGQDRRVGVYQKDKEDYHLKSSFLVYCVGISPSGLTGVYAKGEQSDLQLFNTKNRHEKDTLVGHHGIITQIKFINEKELFSSARDHYVYYWKLD